MLVGVPPAQRERCRSTSGDGTEERELGAAGHHGQQTDAGSSTQRAGKIRSGIAHLHSIGTDTVGFKSTDG